MEFSVTLPVDLDALAAGWQRPPPEALRSPGQGKGPASFAVLLEPDLAMGTAAGEELPQAGNPLPLLLPQQLAPTLAAADRAEPAGGAPQGWTIGPGEPDPDGAARRAAPAIRLGPGLAETMADAATAADEPVAADLARRPQARSPAMPAPALAATPDDAALSAALPRPVAAPAGAEPATSLPSLPPSPSSPPEGAVRPASLPGIEAPAMPVGGDAEDGREAGGQRRQEAGRLLLQGLPLESPSTSSPPSAAAPIGAAPAPVDPLDALGSMPRPDPGPGSQRLDLTQQDGIDGLATRIQWLADRNAGHARISLHPPELGSIEIRLNVADDETVVHMSASHAAARDLLELNLPRLRDLLAQAGLSLADASVSGGDHGRNAGRMAEAPMPETPEPGPPEPAEASAPRRADASRIDLYA